ACWPTKALWRKLPRPWWNGSGSGCGRLRNSWRPCGPSWRNSEARPVPRPAGTPRLIQERLRFGVRPGLDRIRRLLDAVGNPQNAYPIVHVAGTNGKGSTSAMIASIPAASVLKVGLYTSPHLVHYVERDVVDGMPVSHEELDT